MGGSDVSVIVNNFNYARFLRASIDSALGQMDASVEVIVVDDGSTDDSETIIQSYSDSVKAILKAHGGQASAMNAGFRAATGDMVIFLDSDDELLPHTAAAVAAAAAARPSAAKFQYRLEITDADGRRTGTVQPSPDLPFRSGNLQWDVMHYPDDMVWVATSGNAYPRSMLERLGPIPERAYGDVGADWYLSHISPLLGHVVSLDLVGGLYRVHGNNSYQLKSPTIDLRHIEQTVRFAEVTHRYIVQWAADLKLSGRPTSSDDLLSVSYVANRLIRLRLGADHDQGAGDTRGQLIKLGILAASRRTDVAMQIRMAFALWFVWTALVPKRFVRRAAALFLFPQTRPRLTRVIRRWHRGSGGRA